MEDLDLGRTIPNIGCTADDHRIGVRCRSWSRSASQSGVEIVYDGPGGVDHEHGLGLVEEEGIGMGDAGSVADGAEGIDDGG